MDTPRITFVTTGETGDAARASLLEPILAAWPGPSAPAVVEASIDALVAPDGAAPTGPFLVVGGDDLSRAVVAVLADALKGRDEAALVLVPEASSALRAYQGDGVAVESHGADAGVLAAMLYGMCARDGAVTRLRDELNAARATHGGLTGEVARLHEELNLAAMVQREFLPGELPSRPCVDLGVLFRPAAYVSGDIYDISWLDDRRLLFALADAVGHGVPAALLTMVIQRALVVARATGMSAHPAQTMAYLNRALSSACASGQRFATGVVGVLDCETGVARVSVAGHPPPMVFTDGRVERIETNGPLLGVFDQLEFGEAELTLPIGSTLLLYSDGFELAFPGSTREVDTEAYVEHLEAFGSRTMEAGCVAPALHDLAELVDQQRGSLHQRDDLSALAIRRTAVASEVGPRIEVAAA